MKEKRKENNKSNNKITNNNKFLSLINCSAEQMLLEYIILQIRGLPNNQRKSRIGESLKSVKLFLSCRD